MKSKYQPHEFKVICVRECVAAELIDTPELAVKYWRDNIPQAPWFDPMKEALVVLVLNTRKRILGHNLVALGSLDTCPVTPLAVFRPALIQSAASLILNRKGLRSKPARGRRSGTGVHLRPPSGQAEKSV